MRVGGEATGAVEAALAACKEARGHSVSAWAQAVLAADVVMQLAPGRDLSEDMEKAEGDEAPAVMAGKARRPPGTSLDLWRLTQGGFPDGDTLMRPPADAKRAKSARQ